MVEQWSKNRLHFIVTANAWSVIHTYFQSFCTVF